MTTLVKAAFYLWNPIRRDQVTVPNLPSLHLTHFYLGVDLLSGDYDREIRSTTESPQFRAFAQTVRQMCPGVKILLSIGVHRSFLAENATNQVSDVIQILVSQKILDGIDLRWLYPVTAQEMTTFGCLLTQLREVFPPPVLLTAMVFYSSEYWSSLKYPIQAIVDNCDWINVLGFDLYTPDSSFKLTGPPAPLYNPASCQLSGDTGVRSWIKAGVEANKMVFGLPFYGYRWRLVNENNHEIFSPVNRAAPEPKDPITYSQILPFRAVHNFDPSYVTDYCYAGTKWIGYDDEDSVKTKVRYAKKKGLVGYLAWWLEVDRDNWNLQVIASNAWDNA